MQLFWRTLFLYVYHTWLLHLWQCGVIDIIYQTIGWKQNGKTLFQTKYDISYGWTNLVEPFWHNCMRNITKETGKRNCNFLPSLKPAPPRELPGKQLCNLDYSALSFCWLLVSLQHNNQKKSSVFCQFIFQFMMAEKVNKQLA